jgi:hypothetical protein
MKKMLSRLRSDERGLSTAEYAIGTCATAGLAGLLIKLLTSEKMADLLWSLLTRAFSLFNPFG